jgi:HSP20-like domain of unknown function (DUF1813).
MITRYLNVSCLYPSAKSENCIPMINLCGKWLEHAGFIIGDEVSVEVTRKGEIVIRTIHEQVEYCAERDLKGGYSDVILNALS